MLTRIETEPPKPLLTQISEPLGAIATRCGKLPTVALSIIELVAVLMAVTRFLSRLVTYTTAPDASMAIPSRRPFGSVAGDPAMVAE